jgi:hypothetical protein
LEAVRDARPAGRYSLCANGMWDVDTAVAAISALERAAGGLEYVEQPCRTSDELTAVRPESTSRSPPPSPSVRGIRCGPRWCALPTSRSCGPDHWVGRVAR